MKTPADSLEKNPPLKPAEDYYRLRREGIGLLEKLTSRVWTDYNTHDPGITVLENLCYAITDLAYRIGWDIQDLLTPQKPSGDAKQPYPQQAFFTARQILTANPVTPDDFRRVLIDLAAIRNAWVVCRSCVCDIAFYAECNNEKLQLTYQQPAETDVIMVRGLYDVLLELESDPVLGDLNDHKITRTFQLPDSDERYQAVNLELRWPSQHPFWQTKAVVSALNITRFGDNQTHNILTDSKTEQDIYLHQHWRTVFYVDFEINGTWVMANVPLRISGNSTARDLTELDSHILARLGKIDTDMANAEGFIVPYQRKLEKVEASLKEVQATLQQYRNLAEDYCHVQVVDIEDVAVCADIEVSADADIERVQAEVWRLIERYLNPPVPFYSLAELQAEGLDVEAIFQGPELSSGFLKAEDLANAGLKSVLRSSDLLNLLMDLNPIGLVAVNNLLLSKYNAEGRLIQGAADPEWDVVAKTFKTPATGKTSAAWLLQISPGHQPRLDRQLSRFMFIKNGLPFSARLDEANDILSQLQGAAQQPKLKDSPQDLPIPVGSYRDAAAYYPVQYGFPLTYGIGPEGLPAHVSDSRRAQAKQLKAYLLVFEQLLANASQQLAHVADLFALDPNISQTYYSRLFDDGLIKGITELTAGLTTDKLNAMAETPAQANQRKHQFLDHLLARFGEQFSDYALMLSNAVGQQVAVKRLLDDKMAFLKAYPQVSHDRGKAFNYQASPNSPANFSGLKQRVGLLLGYPDLSFKLQSLNPKPGFPGQLLVGYNLTDGFAAIWLTGEISVQGAATAKAAEELASRALLKYLGYAGNYTVTPETGLFRLKVNGVGRHPALLTEAAAFALKDELNAWAVHARAVIVEHILLRPKFPGDALYPVCSEGKCTVCSDADPYSLRLTWVMPGWTKLYNSDMAMRQFAERTILQETPAHLLAKVCWLSNHNFDSATTGFVINDLFEWIKAEPAYAAKTDDALLTLTNKIVKTFADAFAQYYADKIFTRLSRQQIQTGLGTAFNAIAITESDLTGIWPTIKNHLLAYFVNLAVTGWQYERFLDAWQQWLQANAGFNWPEERLTERVTAILKMNLAKGAEAVLCQCAQAIVNGYGAAFNHWLNQNAKQDLPLAQFSVFNPPDVSSFMLCPSVEFKNGTATAIQQLLNARYQSYREVAYRLWLVLHRLSQLSNTYPEATLHDCDDGSDQNPVRLGQTALGTFSLP